MIKRKISPALVVIIFLAAVIMPLLLLARPVVSRAEALPELKIHFLYAGQGDCALIELPDGKKMIIDGSENYNKNRDLVMNGVKKYMPEGFKYFDYAILTHAHSDHCGSLDNVLEAYPARKVYRPNELSNASGYTDPGASDLLYGSGKQNSSSYKKFIETIYKANADFTPEVVVIDCSNTALDIVGGEGDDKYSLTFYSPVYAKGAYSNINNYSPIMVLEYRGYKFAMSGDAERENENEFVAKVNAAPTDGVSDKYDAFTSSYNVNVFKAGHHGSDTATTEAYLDIMTTPEGAASAYYVLSCDPEDYGNTYHHPHAATLNKFKDRGAPDDHILRTDLIGDLNFTVRVDEGGNYTLFYGDTKSDAAPGETGSGSESGSGAGAETGSGTGEVDPTPAEPQEEDGFITFIKENYVVVIIVVVVVIILIIVIAVYVTRHNDDKNVKRAGRKVKRTAKKQVKKQVKKSVKKGGKGKK